MSIATAAPTIRPYGDEDEPGALALLAAALGPGPVGRRSADFLRWKHRDGPFGPSPMLVAEAGGRIVGLRAFMRWRLAIGDRAVGAVRAVDTATDPEHRRTGVFERLTREALARLDDDVALVFNTPNDRSLPGYLKLGWRVAGRVPVSVRVRRPLRFARGLGERRAGSAPPTPAPAASVPTAAEVLGDGDAIAALLADAEIARSRLHTPKDRDYLWWRYAAAPGLDYRAVLEEGRGLAVFRVRSRGRLWESTVSELIVRPGEHRVAARLLRATARAAAVDHAVCAFPDGTAAARAALRTGFVPSRRGITLAVRPLRGVEPDPGRLGSWALSLGDLELL